MPEASTQSGSHDASDRRRGVGRRPIHCGKRRSYRCPTRTRLRETPIPTGERATRRAARDLLPSCDGDRSRDYLGVITRDRRDASAEPSTRTVGRSSRTCDSLTAHRGLATLHGAHDDVHTQTVHFPRCVADRNWTSSRPECLERAREPASAGQASSNRSSALVGRAG